jgi:hypothetical protein
LVDLDVEEDNIKINLKETQMEGVDCIHLLQDREKWRAAVKAVISLRFPQNEGDDGLLASRGVHTGPARLQDMGSVHGHFTS